MQIVCPNCTTSYQIADAAIGDDGRSVRCVRCQTVWLCRRRSAARTDWPMPAADETVAAFRAELGATSRPAVPEAAAPRRAPSAGEPSLDDRHRPTRRPKPTTPADAPAEAPLALADIPIPVERRAAAGAGRGGGAPAGSRSLEGQRPAGHRERGRPPGPRRGPQAARPAAGSAAARDRCAGSPLRGAARLAQGRREACAAARIVL